MARGDGIATLLEYLGIDDRIRALNDNDKVW